MVKQGLVGIKRKVGGKVILNEKGRGRSKNKKGGSKI